MKKTFLFLSLLAVLSACSKPVVEVPRYDVTGRYLGMVTADLIKIKGAPGSVAVLPSGESVWTYKALMTTEQAPLGTGGAVTKWTETVSFVIDNSGRVKSYTTAVEQ